jgi:hypothetical protein
MLDIHRHYTHDLDIHDSSGSGSGSGGSIHTPSTVHTAIISILPPTTASTANFPLDIFPSPPKSYNELGPLRSRPSYLENHYQTSTSNRNSTHRHRHRHVSDGRRRRYSEPTGSSSTEALIEQRRFTMSFDIVVAPSKFGTSGNGNGIQERVVRVGFPQKRRSSIGSTSLSSLSLQCGYGDWSREGKERERARVNEWQEKREGVSNSSNPKNEGSVGKEQDGARVCVYDLIEKEDKAQKESEFSAPLSLPSLPKGVLSTTTTDIPLWPSLPSGPSSPNSNFTSYTRQQDILPPGRVLSGFSDINYSSCSFSVDDHDQGHEYISGVKGDISPTIPIIQLRPDIESAVGILHRPRPLPPRNRARPAPLPLSLSLKTLPPIPSTPDISPIISLSSITQTISHLKTTSAINTNSAGSDCDPTQSVIGNHKESFSASTKPTHEGEQGNEESETYETRTKPCFEKTTSLPSTRSLPLAEIARPASPSNVNQYHPSTRAKGIGASTIDSGSLLVSGSTIETTVPILASPISIYSQHTSSSSPASMPLTLNRSHQDWDQQGE